MPSATNAPLKYLFSVVYKDGSYFYQNREDISKIEPNRSAYYDVKQDEVQQFWLWNGDEGIGIDLSTGTFNTPSHMFTVSSPGPKPYKLVFWRQHTHNFNVEYEEQSHIVKYILGYEDADGVEHTIIME